MSYYTQLSAAQLATLAAALPRSPDVPPSADTQRLDQETL